MTIYTLLSHWIYVGGQVFGFQTPEPISRPMTTIQPVEIDSIIEHQNEPYFQLNYKIS